jgi:hypothetical protein
MLLGAPALGSGDRAEVAVEPAEQQGDGPRVVHQAMAGTGQDAQLRRGVGRVGQLPGTISRGRGGMWATSNDGLTSLTSRAQVPGSGG